MTCFTCSKHIQVSSEFDFFKAEKSCAKVLHCTLWQMRHTDIVVSEPNPKHVLGLSLYLSIYSACIASFPTIANMTLPLSFKRVLEPLGWHAPSPVQSNKCPLTTSSSQCAKTIPWNTKDTTLTTLCLYVWSCSGLGCPYTLIMYS